MYTANDARQKTIESLDFRIQNAVENCAQGKGASLRVYHTDWFVNDIEHQLKERGFSNIYVPVIMLKGDVYFEW